MKLKMNFKSLKILKRIITNESFYQIQLFTLESFDLFENWLINNNILYKKMFTSTLCYNNNELIILFKDTNDFDVYSKSKIILLSNDRDRRFIPYKFILNENEKNKIVNNTIAFNQNKKLSVCSILRKKINISEFIANGLSYIQSIIISCLINESHFDKLFKEIQNIDETINNKFIIKLEINDLLKNKILSKKNPEIYKLNISKETIRQICYKVGIQNTNL